MTGRQPLTLPPTPPAVPATRTTPPACGSPPPPPGWRRRSAEWLERLASLPGLLQGPQQGPDELTSLEERLGLLLPVRIGVGLAVLILAGAAPGEVAAGLMSVTVATVVYLALAVGAEALAQRSARVRVALHRLLLPLDALFLFWTVLPAGGAPRATVLFFVVPLVAVTVLASLRSGLRVAVCDTLALAAARLPWVAQQMRTIRPGPPIATHPVAETVVVVLALWAVAVCAAWFSSVNERELRRAKTELVALTAMAADLEARQSSTEILDGLLRGLACAFRFERAVAVWDDGSSVVVRRLERSQRPADPAADADGGDDPPPSGWADAAAAEVWASGAALAVRSLPVGTNPCLERLLPGARRVVLLPLGPDGSRRGVVAVALGPAPVLGAALTGDRFPARTLAALGQFTSHATLALRNARVSAEQQRLARRDALTGLANRRAFDDALAAEMNRSQRGGQPLSLVVLDIDHFKDVNDTRGHQAGDEALREVGRILEEAVRVSDTAARYGGEEFALVLPACGPGGARRVAEAARAAVARSPALGGLTLSAGVATAPQHAADGPSLIRAADAALYRSKRSGRDRVTVWEEAMGQALTPEEVSPEGG